jgi:hypothetical protein
VSVLVGVSIERHVHNAQTVAFAKPPAKSANNNLIVVFQAEVVFEAERPAAPATDGDRRIRIQIGEESPGKHSESIRFSLIFLGVCNLQQ